MKHFVGKTLVDVIFAQLSSSTSTCLIFSKKTSTCLSRVDQHLLLLEPSTTTKRFRRFAAVRVPTMRSRLLEQGSCCQSCPVHTPWPASTAAPKCARRMGPAGVWRRTATASTTPPAAPALYPTVAPPPTVVTCEAGVYALSMFDEMTKTKLSGLCTWRGSCSPSAFLLRRILI